MLAVPVIEPTLAETVPEPVLVPLKVAPPPLMLEKVPSEVGLTDQAGATGTALWYASQPLAVKRTVLPRRTLALDGDTVMVARLPALTVSVRVAGV
jgi:hypothetical protein